MAPAPGRRSKSLRPLGAESLGLAVAHLEPDSAGADLLSLAQPALEVGGIQVEVGIVGHLQATVQERLHLLVDLLTDVTNLRLGDAALGAKSTHQGIDVPGGNATDLGLHYHAIDGLPTSCDASRLRCRGNDTTAAVAGLFSGASAAAE